MKKSVVYTRGGDKGRTSLADGSRVSKCHARLEAYGTVDELNAQLGLLVSLLEQEPDAEEKHKIALFIGGNQHLLFSVGGWLATPAKEGEASVCYITPAHTAALESETDRMDAELVPLTAFVIPGGCVAASQAHVCRTVCRRAERHIVELADEVSVDGEILKYVNRLSDYLFVLSRYLNHLSSSPEIFWKKG